MNLTEETFFSGGTYQVTVTANGGSVDLQISVDDQDYQIIPTASYSADTVVQIDIAASWLKPVITGNAVTSINQIPNFSK